MLKQLKNPKLYLMLLADSSAFVVALALAAAIRFEFVLDAESRQWILTDLAFIIPLKLLVFTMFGLYTGMWRYIALVDFWRIAQAAGLSMVLTWSVIHFAGVGHIPRSVLVMDAVFTFMGPGIIRVLIRQWYDSWRGKPLTCFIKWPTTGRRRHDHATRVVIIGAGDAAQAILREIEGNPKLQYAIVGLVDDDSAKQGRTLRGVSVLGSVTDLPSICRRYAVDEIIIATPSADRGQMRRIVEQCDTTGLTYKTVPSISGLIDGRVRVADLREVDYLDLLGRPPVELDSEPISNYLTGRTVLVTGCGGSIGSELVRKVASFKPARLVLLDSSELNLFNIVNELRMVHHFESIEPILGRVQTESLMDHIFSLHRPTAVFHAAAYKHVHLVEQHPWEAVFNNVIGSKVAMETAARHGVERFVLVSTDKAVRPSNIMGASKRIAELVMQTMNGGHTRFMAVRFGNVVGSSGSVIPLFQSQIEKGGPVTVTHPDATRFFMTIPEAASLILQAGTLGRRGEIFVLEMGTPVRIMDMARDLIKLSGKAVGEDIRIEIVGLRPGEKIDEELITDDENILPTSHDKIMVLQGRPMALDNDRETVVCREWLEPLLRELVDRSLKYDAEGIRTTMIKIVRDFKQSDYCPVDGDSL